MSNVVGLSVFGLGIALLIIAFDALGAPRSEVFQMTGISQHDSPWLLTLGVITVLAGFFLALRGARRE